MTYMPHRGYIEFRRLLKDNKLSMHSGESKWFATAGREFGLWYLTVHGFGLYFSVIGPFSFREIAQ